MTLFIAIVVNLATSAVEVLSVGSKFEKVLSDMYTDIGKRDLPCINSGAPVVQIGSFLWSCSEYGNFDLDRAAADVLAEHEMKVIEDVCVSRLKEVGIDMETQAARDLLDTLVSSVYHDISRFGCDDGWALHEEFSEQGERIRILAKDFRRGDVISLTTSKGHSFKNITVSEVDKEMIRCGDPGYWFTLESITME